MKEFILGLAAGMAGGAIIVANSCKLRQMIKKNQAECYIDEKLEKGSQPRQSGAAEGGAKKKEN